MDLETVGTFGAAGLLLAVTLPLALLAFRQGSGVVRVAALPVWMLACAGVVWAMTGIREPEPVTDRPVQRLAEGYVSSSTCRSCHPGPYATWHRSYHRTMTQVATTDTVAGPLSGGVAVDARGQTYELEARGDEVWVRMDDPTWQSDEPAPRIERQVVQTTGSHEEQFLWTSTGKGRKLSLLPVMFRLLDEQRWAPLDGCCVTPPHAVQESEAGRWNRVCNRCHATHAWPRIEGPDRMDTVVAELGIACEACHGPAQDHVARNGDPRRRYALHDGDGVDDSIVNPSRLDHEQSSHVCAQCHGVTGFLDDAAAADWRQNGYRFQPGEVLTDRRKLHTEGVDKFWSDGVVRVSGREFNGLVRSPCYVDGDMSCLSCHAMHQAPDDPRPIDEWANDQLHPGMDGDHACTQCHEEYLDETRLAEHTHHAVGSSGSECMNCHMPYTTYGLLKAIRSHEVTNPSVQESVATGRPNACNQCHIAETLDWAGEHLERWYGTPRPSLGLEERTLAASVMWALRGDAGQRALMAWTFGWEAARETTDPDWTTPFLIALMRDPYHAVRYIANRSFVNTTGAQLPGYDFMAAGDRILHQTAPAFVQWAEAGKRTPSPRHLIGPNGEFDVARLEALLEKRDDRDVTLNE